MSTAETSAARPEVGRRTVEINFGGEVKPFRYDPEELAGGLREEAIRRFHVTQNPHLLGLFRKDDVELQDAQTLREGGVRPGDRLLLRPSVVRGG